MPPVWKGSNCKADVAIIEKQIKHQWANQTKRQRERVIVMNIRWKCTVYHGLAHAGYLTSGLITCTGLKFLSRGTFSYTVYTICTARSKAQLFITSKIIHLTEGRPVQDGSWLVAMKSYHLAFSCALFNK